LTAAGRIAAEQVVPGPGYLAIELARASFRVAVDISHSFVEMGRAHATRAGVEVDFRHGNAAALPFEEGTFYCVRLPGGVQELHRAGAGRFRDAPRPQARRAGRDCRYAQ
jgi:hypothetical protein